MRRSEKKNCLKQLEALDSAIQKSNKTLLREKQELEELEKLVAQKKEYIEAEVKVREQNAKTYDTLSEKLLDDKTIQKTLTYGINKGILDGSMISILPKTKFEQLTSEQRRALLDILVIQNKENSFSTIIDKGIDFVDNLVEKLTTDTGCEEDLDDGN